MPNKNILEIEIIDTGISYRAYHCLKRIGVKTIGDLSQKTYSQIFDLKSATIENIEEIVKMLYSYGLEFRDD